jgi:SAM-dependent methyltransferase
MSGQRCRICGRNISRLFSQRGFEVWSCACCGFISMAPIGDVAPVDYDRLYGEAYYGRGERSPDSISRYDLANILETKLPQARDALRLIAQCRQFRAGARLLDVGCSVGVFLKAAGEAGFRAVGLDISPVATRYARESFGVDARTGTLETFDLAGERFDVVTMWDVLEHLEDPWRAMERVNKLLAPGGLVALRTPNAKSLRPRLFGFAGWDMISPPEHYHLFARKSLQLFLSQFGYRVVKLMTVHSNWIYYRRSNRLVKLPFRLSGALGLGGDLVAVAERAA